MPTRAAIMPFFASASSGLIGPAFLATILPFRHRIAFASIENEPYDNLIRMFLPIH